RIVQQSVDAIGKAQREDGYIHTPTLIRSRNGDTDAQPFQDRHNFEMYNMGHLLTAACVHHRVTGREDFLAIAVRAADFLYDAFHEPTSDLARNSVCPSHYMGIVELYRATGDIRYLALARTFLEMRQLFTDGDDDNQDRIPFTEQREAMGHAVRANYLYAGAADLLMETGDARLRDALEAIWANVVHKKMYITGACGALYDGASPYGSSKQSSIARVHQSYGHNYQLPNTTAHGETCAALGAVFWNWRMFLATGDARYIDVVELALYNAVLAGVSLEGSDYFYVNPLRNVDPLPTHLRWSRTRTPYVTSYCCPPNVLRTIAEVHGYAYGKGDRAIWFNLYGSSVLSTTLDGEPVELTQATDYPWNGHVRVTLNRCPDTEFALRMRIPGWAESAALRVNGEPVDADVTACSYTEIRRRWQAGDIVELDLPMPAQLVEAHPLVEEARNQVAVKRGPIVYCLESQDLPEGVRVRDVVVPADAELVPRSEGELLGGVTVIEGDAIAMGTDDWEGRLYRPLSEPSATRIRARFIPYYTWANRGESEMSVWLRLRPGGGSPRSTPAIGAPTEARELSLTDGTTAAERGAVAGNRYRVLVSTDIGGTDPDDFQSMAHLLVYADRFDIEGLVSSAYGPGRKEHILEVIDHYATDYPNLVTYSDKYPAPEALRAIAKQGEIEVAPYAGVRQATEGSDWIVQCARRDDLRPLHVLAWGGIEDLAQALHDAPDILPKLRVYWIGGPNKKWSPDAYQYIVEHHPELWIIETNAAYRGWFTGGDQSGELENSAFVAKHVAGKGAVGAFFAGLLGGAIKMGDTPSVGWLLKGTPDDPSQPGWGGRFVRAWHRPHAVYNRLTTAADHVEQFGVFELVLPVGDDVPDDAEARLEIENQSLEGTFTAGSVRFRFSPKAPKQYSYTVRSNAPALDGQGGRLTAILPPMDAAKRPSPEHPNWTDDPASEFAEGEHIGAKTVSQWRADYLADFAARLLRCQSPKR
ncbi:MAG: beta-L-arabinofuranosidase domain-containing protein, partial [Candidatus Poribacteria bacterium]